MKIMNRVSNIGILSKPKVSLTPINIATEQIVVIFDLKKEDSDAIIVKLCQNQMFANRECEHTFSFLIKKSFLLNTEPFHFCF